MIRSQIAVTVPSGDVTVDGSLTVPPAGEIAKEPGDEAATEGGHATHRFRTLALCPPDFFRA